MPIVSIKVTKRIVQRQSVRKNNSSVKTESSAYTKATGVIHFQTVQTEAMKRIAQTNRVINVQTNNSGVNQMECAFHLRGVSSFFLNF